MVDTWSRLNAMTEEQRHAAGLADPDAQPLSDADMDRIKPTPRRRSVTRDAAPGASQSRCSARLAERVPQSRPRVPPWPIPYRFAVLRSSIRHERRGGGDR